MSIQGTLLDNYLYDVNFSADDPDGRLSKYVDAAHSDVKIDLNEIATTDAQIVIWVPKALDVNIFPLQQLRIYEKERNRGITVLQIFDALHDYFTTPLTREEKHNLIDKCSRSSEYDECHLRMLKEEFEYERSIGSDNHVNIADLCQLHYFCGLERVNTLESVNTMARVNVAEYSLGFRVDHEDASIRHRYYIFENNELVYDE